jgi:HD-like signal output (HDOD) protein
VEEITTAGLLHDIGKVIIGLKCADQLPEIRRRIKSDELYISEAEKAVLDTDHAEVGGWLSKSWFLPDKLSEPIAFHHNVTASEDHRIKTSVVHLADILIKASGFGDSGDQYVPPLQQVAWDALKLDEALLQEMVMELEDKLIEVKNFSLEMQVADAAAL